MFRFWMTLALMVIFWVGRTEATELTGFGPIKFGMTKEEALAALEAVGIEAKWKRGFESFEYKYPLHDRARLTGIPRNSKFAVRQYFVDDIATTAFVEMGWQHPTPELCFDDSLYFVLAVKEKYGDMKFIQETIDNRYVLSNKIHGIIYKNYLIPFKDESYIQMTATADMDDIKKLSCTFSVFYHPPVPNPIPF